MSRTNTTCDFCGAGVQLATRLRNGGACAPCHKINRADEVCKDSPLSFPRFQLVFRVSFAADPKIAGTGGDLYFRCVSRGDNDAVAERAGLRLVENTIKQLSPKSVAKCTIALSACRPSTGLDFTKFRDVSLGDFVPLDAVSDELPEPQDRAIPDMDRVDALLFELARKSIEEFFSSHADESFYAFGFDCNAEYGDVLLCANTDAEFEKTKRHYVERWKYRSEEQFYSLRRSFGDWTYQGFNMDQVGWNEAWESVEHEIQRAHGIDQDQAIEDEEQTEAFLQCVCRVLIRLERDPVFERISKTEDFFVQVCDHDEDVVTADARLARVRATLAI